MPEPKEGESKSDFVSRCIPIVLDDGTAEDQDQAVAVCNSMWEDRGKGNVLKAISRTDDELRVLDTLGERPHSVAELAERAGSGHWLLLPTARLEANCVVQRAGLTPTDLLHVFGHFQQWDEAAAARLCQMVSHVVGSDAHAFAQRVIDEVVRRLALELLKKQLDEETDPDAMDQCPVCQTFLEGLLRGTPADYRLSVTLTRPIVGLGAPVHYFLPPAARLLNTEATIPPDADVANAIGAITSSVVVHRQAQIAPNEAGGYAVHGLPNARSFAQFADAHAYAAAELERLVREQARAAGTSESAVEMQVDDRISEAADGTELFLERVLTARLTGAPDVPLPACTRR